MDLRHILESYHRFVVKNDSEVCLTGGGDEKLMGSRAGTVKRVDG